MGDIRITFADVSGSENELEFSSDSGILSNISMFLSFGKGFNNYYFKILIMEESLIIIFLNYYCFILVYDFLNFIQ